MILDCQPGIKIVNFDISNVSNENLLVAFTSSERSLFIIVNFSFFWNLLKIHTSQGKFYLLIALDIRLKSFDTNKECTFEMMEEISDFRKSNIKWLKRIYPWLILGIIRKKLSRGTTSDAVSSQLASNDSSRPACWTVVAKTSQNRSGTSRHPRMDVLQHHVLDAVRTLWCTLQL